jgi:hypothetical protein
VEEEIEMELHIETKSYIKKDNSYDNLLELDLNDGGDDIGVYKRNYNDVVYNNKEIPLDRYGNSFHFLISSLCSILGGVCFRMSHLKHNISFFFKANIDRFDEVIKRRGRRACMLT